MKENQHIEFKQSWRVKNALATANILFPKVETQFKGTSVIIQREVENANEHEAPNTTQKTTQKSTLKSTSTSTLTSTPRSTLTGTRREIIEIISNNRYVC